MRKISNAKIKKVMVSNYLFTLFFDNDVKIEIYKSYFRGTKCPRKGDLFTWEQYRDEEGKIVNRFYLNGKEVISKPLSIF